MILSEFSTCSVCLCASFHLIPFGILYTRLLYRRKSFFTSLSFIHARSVFDTRYTHVFCDCVCFVVIYVSLCTRAFGCMSVGFVR
jgi:hypothetical protein